MDVKIRTMALLIKASSAVVSSRWFDCVGVDPHQRVVKHNAYHEAVATDAQLGIKLKDWMKTLSMSQLLELDGYFTDEDTVGSIIFSYISALYEAQGDLLLMLMAADVSHLPAHSATLKMVFWRKDPTFARMFVEKFKKTDLWYRNETACRYVCSGIVASI